MVYISTADFCKHVPEYLDQAVLYQDVIHVNTRDGNAVILSEDDYRGLRETLYLLSVPGMRERLLEGLNTPVSECVVYDPDEPW